MTRDTKMPSRQITSLGLRLPPPIEENLPVVCSHLRSTLITSNTEEDLDAILLRAIEPPDHSRLTLQGALCELKLYRRRTIAFKQLLQRVQMNVWTLHFHHEYETAYCEYLYLHAIPRIRYAVWIEIIFVFLKFIYEYIRAIPLAESALFVHEWSILLHLHAYMAIPVLCAVLCCTYISRLNPYCEWYASIPFLLITYLLTAQKIVVGSKGPIFALFLVLVPVFGITRFRFTTSVLLVTLMFTGHIVALLCLQDAEITKDIMFQGLNYLGGIVVGVVCHYRAEILRRRNYVMLLSFGPQSLNVERMRQKLKDPRAKKNALLHRWTLKFKNELVEEAFYRHWYLIDPCPFDHPNAGELHRTVYRSVRFAIGAVICSQIMLVMQDWEYLYADKSFPSAAYTVSTCLRLAIVIPAYIFVPLAMSFYGTRFYWQWREQATSQDRGGVRSPTSSSHRRHFILSSESSHYSEDSYMTLSTPVGTAQNHNIRQNGISEQLLEKSSQAKIDPLSTPFKQNYVRVLQYLSAGVVFIHALAMGIILLLVDKWATDHKASVAPCYFLGFLNALLFPHRSGFRVRFVYATAGTICVCVLVIATALFMKSPKVLMYGSYMILTNVLGMMVSHEEESLRRIFFVRMMIRSDEFRRRHDAILILEPWLKQFIRQWRKTRSTTKECCTIDIPSSTISTEKMDVTHMTQAAKYGMVLDVGRTAIAALVELV